MKLALVITSILVVAAAQRVCKVKNATSIVSKTVIQENNLQSAHWRKWQGQVIILVGQIDWTAQIDAALSDQENGNSKLGEYHKRRRG